MDAAAKSKRRNWLVVLLLAAAAGWGAWALAPRADLVTYWQQQLLELPDNEVIDVLDQLAGRGDVGVQVLATSLGSSRTIVATRSEALLRGELARWRQLSPGMAAPRLAVLAEALATHVEQYEPERRAVAAELAEAILLAPHDTHSAHPTNLARHCHRILEAADNAPLETQPRHDAAAARAATALRTPLVQHAPTTPTANTSLPPLPLTPASSPAPQPLPPAHVPPQPLSTKPDDTPLPTTTAQKPDATPASATRPLGPAPTASVLARTPAVELFTLVHSDGPAAREAAMELKRRKFTPRQIEVGLGVTHPDPQVRRQWAEALPGLAGVEAKPWLLWLCNDAEPEVRRTVLTLLATSDDPEMLARVARAAREDTDDRVREQASRLLVK